MPRDPVVDDLVDLFIEAAAAARDAVAAIAAGELRRRTARVGQYALDVAADAAACAVLERAPLRIVSEESGVHERDEASVTVVLDPIDGSTNCARGIAYWATSICALDHEGPLVSLVANHGSGQATVAVRGKGATRDGLPLRASVVTRLEDAVVGLGGLPTRRLPWKQSRMLGCLSLMLVEVAAGGIDAHLDPGPYHAPWDYLGALLACTEAGAIVRDVHGQPLVTADVDARRQVVAAGTAQLADALVQGSS